MKRWINSEHVPVCSPVTDFLCGLPHWNGKDRVRTLACYVPCDNSHRPDFFRHWSLAMVAHWKGNDEQYTNSVPSLLIGSQGYGKPTYCRNILPSDLRAYYTDSIDFSRKHDAELCPNRFMLINVDEFDQISINHQGFLKHILQKPVLSVRKPSEAAVRELKRYASFIATSDHSNLLPDLSGSRRFICISIAGRIRSGAVISYPQLYARAVQELRDGERFYFSSEEEAILTESNQEFELQTPVEQLFQQYFRSAGEGGECETLLTVDALGRIRKKGGFKLSATKVVYFGRVFRKLGVPCRKMKDGNFYCAVEL